MSPTPCVWKHAARASTSLTRLPSQHPTITWRASSSSSAGDKRRPRDSLLRRNLAPLSPPTPPPSKTKYSPLTVALVKGTGRLLGYNFVRSKAIKVTGDLYDRAAMRAQAEAHFWYKECALPASFQTWFQLTNLHVFLLLSRIRALPSQEAKTYSQELINHFFIDTESRMRERFGVQTSRLVKGYMKDLHLQHRGSTVAYEEGLATDDIRLSAAIWRNVWGGGWGVIGGVKRKAPSLSTKKSQHNTLQASGRQPSNETDKDGIVVADNQAHGDHEDAVPDYTVDQDALMAQDKTDGQREARAELLFPQHLERVTRWLRREVYRLGHLPDETVMDGDVHAPRAVVEDVVGPPSASTTAAMSATSSSQSEGGVQTIVSAYTRI